MSEDRRSRTARDTVPEPPEGDDALRHVRWDKRLEAARARRAKVLSEKRARGEDEGQTLISRRPWEDEAAGVLPTDLPRREMPKAPPVAHAPKSPAPAPPVPPEGRAKAPRPAARQSAPASAPVPVSAPGPEAGARHDAVAVPAADGKPRRRVGRRGGLWAAFAVGGLVAAGALVIGAGRMPSPVTGPDGAPATVTETVAQGAVTPDPVPDVLPENAAAQTTALAPPDAAEGRSDEGGETTAPEAVPEAVPEAAPEAAPDAAPEPSPESGSESGPETAGAAEPDLAAPQAIDLAALSAIALPEAPVGESSDLALAAGAIGGDARAPRSPAPPPLMSPADPVLAGLGVRAQRQAPAMPSSAATSAGTATAPALAPRAVTGTTPATETPRLALPDDPDRPVRAGSAAPALVLAAVGARTLAPEIAESAPPVLQAPADSTVRLAAAAPDAGPPVAPPRPGSAPAVDPTPPAPPRPELPEPELPQPALPAAVADIAAADVAPLTEAVPDVAPAAVPDDAPAAAAEPVAVPDAEAVPPAPPRAEAVLVHILVPAEGAGQTAGTLSDAVAALGYTRRDPAPVSVTIRQTQVRYYHPEDAEAAQLVAGAVGGPARDFTDFRPAPPEGTIEVWLEGEAPPPPPAPVRAPAPVRVQPAPPPPPQPQGFCFRGEPGTPGALRVPIVDGRCAWP